MTCHSGRTSPISGGFRNRRSRCRNSVVQGSNGVTHRATESLRFPVFCLETACQTQESLCARKIDVLRLKTGRQSLAPADCRCPGHIEGRRRQVCGAAAAAGLYWEVVQGADEAALERRRLGHPPKGRATMGGRSMAAGIAAQGHDADVAVRGVSGRSCRPPDLRLFPVLR